MSKLNRPIIRTQIRLPSELADYLRQQATANRRSLNNEMVLTLERARESEQAKAEKAKGLTAPTVAPSCDSTPSKEDGTRNEC